MTKNNFLTTLKDKSLVTEYKPEILLTDAVEPHWNEEMTDDEYHSLKDFIGSSGLRLVYDSPRAFFWDHFKNQKRRETEALRLGKIIHKAVLEGEKFLQSYVVCPDFGDQRSPKNREAKAKWYLEVPKNQIVVTEQELEMIVGIVYSFMDHPQGPKLIQKGKAECAGFFQDEETGIRQKIKPDFLSFNGAALVDLKSTKDSRNMKFANSAFELRYDFQLAMYAIGTKKITGNYPEVIAFAAVEKIPPYECAIYFFDKADLIQAEIDYYGALRKLKGCITRNNWPQRQAQAQRLYPPDWFIKKSNMINEVEYGN